MHYIYLCNLICSEYLSTNEMESSFSQLFRILIPRFEANNRNSIDNSRSISTSTNKLGIDDDDNVSIKNDIITDRSTYTNRLLIIERVCNPNSSNTNEVNTH